MIRYKYMKLMKLGPVDGFLIHTPDGRKLRDTHPQTIVKELNRMADRIKRLEEGGDEAIYPFGYDARVRIWNEAKKAKP